MQKTGQNMLTIHADAACSRHLLMVHTHNTHLPIHADSTDCCRTRPFTVAGQYGISTRFPFHLRRQTASAPAETIYSSSRRTRGRILNLLCRYPGAITGTAACVIIHPLCCFLYGFSFLYGFQAVRRGSFFMHNPHTARRGSPRRYPCGRICRRPYPAGERG